MLPSSSVRCVKPRVLHVAAFTNPSGGGFISSLARLAENDAFETALLCPRTSARFAWTRRLAERGVRVHFASTPLEAAAAVARVNPDVVHAHFVQWMLAAAAGAKVARARVAWHFHSGAVRGAGMRDLARRLKYATAKRIVERFFCVSPDVVEYLLGYGVPAERIAELPNGVDLEHFRAPTLRERAAARRRFAIAPRERVLAFFGRDAHVKGADRLARALDGMPVPPRVLLVAASPQARELLAGRNVIDAGQLADVRDAYWACDALALPSRVETVTYALLEARACGLAAVAAPLPGLVRAFSPDAGTALVDPVDAHAFAQSLDRALAADAIPFSPEMRERASLDVWAGALASWYVSARAA